MWSPFGCLKPAGLGASEALVRKLNSETVNSRCSAIDHELDGELASSRMDLKLAAETDQLASLILKHRQGHTLSSEERAQVVSGIERYRARSPQRTQPDDVEKHHPTEQSVSFVVSLKQVLFPAEWHL